MSNDRSGTSEPLSIEHGGSSETESNTRNDSADNSQLCAVLEAMETHMSQTHEY